MAQSILVNEDRLNCGLVKQQANKDWSNRLRSPARWMEAADQPPSSDPGGMLVQ